MKKLIFLMGMALAFTGVAQNFIKPGTEWIIKCESSDASYPNVESWNEHIIAKNCQDVNADYFEIWRFNSNYESESKLIAYVKTDADKVYFKQADEDWMLIYDFSLQPGAEAIIQHPNTFLDMDAVPSSYAIKCIEVVEENPEFNNYDTLIIAQQDGEEGSYNLVNTIWIKGIGSNRGFLNNIWEFDLDGGFASSLQEVWCNGEKVYEASSSGTNGINKSTIEIGKEQTVNDIYDLSGRKINSSLKESLHPGIYVYKGKKIIR